MYGLIVTEAQSILGPWVYHLAAPDILFLRCTVDSDVRQKWNDVIGARQTGFARIAVNFSIRTVDCFLSYVNTNQKPL